MSSAALSSKRMSCMLGKHHAISFLRCVSTLPLSCNPFLPSASRYCEDRELTRRWRRPRCDGRGDRRSIDAGTSASSSTTKRDFFYGPPSSWEAEYEELIARRNKNIVMHPLGHGQHILPGNFVLKKNPQTGAEKKVMLEHALGYFWAFKVRKYPAPAHDANLRTVHVENSYVFLTFFRSPAPRRKSPILQELSLTDNKPILSNGTVIPVAEAETFPTLKGLVNLHEEVVDIPDFFTRNNRECFACMVLRGVILALSYYH